MKSSVHSGLSVVFLVVALIGAYYLDRLVFAGLTRTETFMDSSWAWSKIASRLITSGLLLTCALFVLHRRQPSPSVGLLYLLAGAYFTFLQLPYFAIRFAPGSYLAYAHMTVALPIAGAFSMIIGFA